MVLASRSVLLLVALVALPVAGILYRLAHVPTKRTRFNDALTAIAAAIALLVTAGTIGWTLALPVTILLVAALLLTYAWAWRFDSFVEGKSDRLFAERPELEQKAASNPILKRLMKKPPR